MRGSKEKYSHSPGFKFYRKPNPTCTKGHRICALECAKSIMRGGRPFPRDRHWQFCHCGCPASWVIFERNWITARCKEHLPKPYLMNPYVSIKVFNEEIEHHKQVLALERS